LQKKILFTGGSGLLALNWANLICNDFDVVLGFHERVLNLTGVESLSINLETEKEFLKCVNRIKPDCIVHAAGMTNVDKCEYFPEVANKINFEGAKFVSNVCVQNNIDLIFISTDHLFDGTIPNVSEDHFKNPLNCYGRSKSLADDFISINNPNALIIRTNFFGWGTTYRESFSDFVIYNLRKGSKITLFKDVYYTPILIDTLVELVMDLFFKKAKGVFNVVGNERLSKLDFGLKVANSFDLNTNLIYEGSILDNNYLVNRPNDLSLSNMKIKKFLQTEISSLNDQIMKLRKNELTKFSNLSAMTI
jgi:dTDP-4-dehydrorhamnose reductase